jgi:hypothetical protein
MKVPISAVIAFILSIGMSLRGQPPAPVPAQETKQAVGATPAATPTEQDSGLEGDLFAPLRESADQFKAEYEDLRDSSMKEIDRVLLTKRCVNLRVDGLLDRLIIVEDKYYLAEKRYWQDWNEKETKRVDSQTKEITSMEEFQARVADQIEDEKKNQEVLAQDKATLENSKRTEEIKAQIDGLIKDVQDSQARLTAAQSKFNELTVSITNMRASLTARLVSIRQNLLAVEAWHADTVANFDSKRTAAQEICMMKQPSSSTPLPKSGGK